MKNTRNSWTLNWPPVPTSPNLKPSIYSDSHSNLHTRSPMRRLKCFVLEHSVFKTKHMRCLVWSFVRDYKYWTYLSHFIILFIFYVLRINDLTYVLKIHIYKVAAINVFLFNPIKTNLSCHWLKYYYLVDTGHFFHICPAQGLVF